MTSIAVVTPWLNHVELADDYFEAVLPALEDGDESIIVDNASDPPLPFGGLTPGANLGYAGGCNFGLRAASAAAVVFLNNDVAVVRRNWLEEIRAALEPGVLVGPFRDGPHTDVDGQRLPYIDGWCIAGMRADLLALGGYDPDLTEPAYFSDNLLCLEARAAGMTLREVRVGLHHKENVTAGPWTDSRVAAATAANRARYEARARELLALA